MSQPKISVPIAANSASLKARFLKKETGLGFLYSFFMLRSADSGLVISKYHRTACSGEFKRFSNSGGMMAMADFTLFQMPEAGELLHSVSTAVDIQDPQWEAFGQKMLDFMAEINKGVAIAAIQLGCPWRIFVMDLNRRLIDRKYKLRTVLNPEILEKSPSTVLNREGCLSVPDTYDTNGWVPVERSISIRVRYWTPLTLLRAGGRVMEIPSEQVEAVLEGAEAFAFQHEYDHVDGILITDRCKPSEDGISLQAVA